MISTKRTCCMSLVAAHDVEELTSVLRKPRLVQQHRRRRLALVDQRHRERGCALATFGRTSTRSPQLVMASLIWAKSCQASVSWLG
jgi:hypothetical protein